MPNSVNSDYRFGLHPITRLLRSQVRGCCSLKRSEYTLYSEVDFVLGLSNKKIRVQVYLFIDFVLDLGISNWSLQF
jgi:hypothetical protein